jgi:hypothetical protein
LHLITLVLISKSFFFESQFPTLSYFNADSHSSALRLTSSKVTHIYINILGASIKLAEPVLDVYLRDKVTTDVLNRDHQLW